MSIPLIEDARLSSRIKNAAKAWGIDLVPELRLAHEAGKTKQWRGVGKGTLAELDRFFAPSPIRRGQQRKKEEVTSDLEPLNRRVAPLHERLEFMAMQMAAEVGRNYSAGQVHRAISLFQLAEYVRERRP